MKTTESNRIEFEAAVSLMDDDLRENLHDKLAPCTEQQFMAAYAAAHQARFGEPFEVN